MEKYQYSVIIPHSSTNGTSLLERAVNSIPERDDIQVLVVDNSPVPIPTDFMVHRNLSVLYSPRERCAGGARNVGIEHSDGKWLLFLDADDFFVESAFDAFDRYVDSKYDVVYFKVTSSFTDTGQLADRHLRIVEMIDEYKRTGDESELRYSFVVPWAKLVRASIVKNNGLKYDEVRVCNDVYFGALLGVFAETITADDAICCCITVNRGSLSNLESLSYLKLRLDVKIRKNDLLKSHSVDYRVSLMKQVVQSAKYGVVPFFQVLWKAMSSGYLLCGWRNWLRTVTWLKNDMKKDYVVKEK